MSAPSSETESTMVLALRSELLGARGVRHGFSTRIGGVSEGPFATLNLAASPGDDRAKVAENFGRFSRAVGVDASRLHQTSQVHGAAVRVVSQGDDRLALLNEEADALVAREPECGIGVRVADCVPLLLHDARSGHVAAIHAGWRGVVAGVVRAGVETLAPARTDRSGIVAAIGPSIGPCCFEVGEDVAKSIVEAALGDGSIVRRTSLKPHVDLRRAVRLQLRALGIDDAHIEDVAGCTFCEPKRFFSFRRDGARSGRHLAAIAPLTPVASTS
jgi:YfiH family protein